VARRASQLRLVTASPARFASKVPQRPATHRLRPHPRSASAQLITTVPQELPTRYTAAMGTTRTAPPASPHSPPASHAQLDPTAWPTPRARRPYPLANAQKGIIAQAAQAPAVLPRPTAWLGSTVPLAPQHRIHVRRESISRMPKQRAAGNVQQATIARCRARLLAPALTVPCVQRAITARRVRQLQGLRSLAHWALTTQTSEGRARRIASPATLGSSAAPPVSPMSAATARLAITAPLAARAAHPAGASLLATKQFTHGSTPPTMERSVLLAITAPQALQYPKIARPGTTAQRLVWMMPPLHHTSARLVGTAWLD